MWNWDHQVVLIELLSWWPKLKCGLQTRGLTDSTGNENCFDPSRHRDVQLPSNELAATVCSWVPMNTGKTFCHTSIDALKKRHCCHKCCECMGMHIAWICLAVQIYNNYMHTASCRIMALLHRCQPSRFRRDTPEFDFYVPLSRFTNRLSRFLSSAVSAVQQLVHS